MCEETIKEARKALIHHLVKIIRIRVVCVQRLFPRSDSNVYQTDIHINQCARGLQNTFIYFTTTRIKEKAGQVRSESISQLLIWLHHVIINSFFFSFICESVKSTKRIALIMGTSSDECPSDTDEVRLGRGLHGIYLVVMR